MSDGAAAAPIKAAGLAGPDAAAGGAGAVQIHMMALPEVFGGNEGDAARAVEPGADPALAADAAAPDAAPAAAPAAVVADEDAEGGVSAPVDFESMRSKTAAEFAALCGADETQCPWCGKQCCRQLGDAALIELRAHAAMVPIRMRASGIAFLATALAARADAAGPRADGAPRRRGAGRDVKYVVHNVPVCRLSFLWVNRFTDSAWKLALTASDERGVYVPPHGLAGQSLQSEQEKANRRAVEVFWINYFRNYGYPIPATQFSDTTEVLAADTTVRNLYKDNFLPAICAEVLGRFEFTEDEAASPPVLAFLKSAATSIRRTLSSDPPRRRRGDEGPRAPARALAAIAATICVPEAIASSEEAVAVVKERVVTIATAISRSIACLPVFRDVFKSSPVLAKMGIAHSCTFVPVVVPAAPGAAHVPGDDGAMGAGCVGAGGAGAGGAGAVVPRKRARSAGARAAGRASARADGDVAAGSHEPVEDNSQRGRDRFARKPKD